MHTYTPHGDDSRADEYVESFELDHFEFIKREPTQSGPSHVDILPACACGQWADSPLPQPYVAIAVVPQTSPPLARNCFTSDVEELHTREPLDMRTFEELNHREWRQREYIPDQTANCSSNTSRMSQDQPCGGQLISDYMLLTLSVPELHKRLHGFPRHDVTILKKKRRTLKNRGYAQDCRSKRLQKRQELEMRNRSLQDELHLLQLQVARVTHERDVLKQRLALVGREHTVPQHSHAPPTPHSSPEFFSEL